MHVCHLLVFWFKRSFQSHIFHISSLITVSPDFYVFMFPWAKRLSSAAVVRSSYLEHEEQLRFSFVEPVYADRTREPGSRSVTRLSSFCRMCSTKQRAASSMFVFSWGRDERERNSCKEISCFAATAQLKTHTDSDNSRDTELIVMLNLEWIL